MAFYDYVRTLCIMRPYTEGRLDRYRIGIVEGRFIQEKISKTKLK